tara:strand:- start:2028 stop:2480 length:453 start_codon:yes stop_codon:yes gene_type:complete
MIKKIFILYFLFLFGCNYQPIYLNKNLENLQFYQITQLGDKKINKAILSSTNLKEDKTDKNLNELFITSTYVIEETSLSSKKTVQTYNSKIVVNLQIKQDEKVLRTRNFVKEFNYDNKEIKFELTKYQNKIKNNLLNSITEEIILYLNIK